MRDNSNKKLIIITLLIMLCLASFYGVIKYYSGKDIEVRLVDKENMADIIESPFDDYNLADTNLGDVNNKWLNKNETCKIVNVSECCKSIPLSETNTRLYCEKHCDDVCSACRDTAELSNYRCHTCNKDAGYKKDSSGKCTLDMDSRCAISYVKINPTNNEWVRLGTISQNQDFTIRVRTNNYCPPNYIPSLSIKNGSTKDKGTLKQEGNRQFSAVASGICPSVTVSASINGTSMSASLKVLGGWQDPVKVPEVIEPACTTSICADKEDSPSPDRYYEQDSEGKYTIMHTRGCSSGYSSETPACYGDASVLSLATSVKWIKPSQKDSVNRIEIKGVTKKADCVLLQKNSPSFCEPKNITATPQTKTASTCEDNIEIKTTDGLSCDKNPFYTIKCDNTIITKFDNGDDGNKITTTNEIYVGQGFKYGITVNTKIII